MSDDLAAKAASWVPPWQRPADDGEASSPPAAEAEAEDGPEGGSEPAPTGQWDRLAGAKWQTTPASSDEDESPDESVSDPQLTDCLSEDDDDLDDDLDEGHAGSWNARSASPEAVDEAEVSGDEPDAEVMQSPDQASAVAESEALPEILSGDEPGAGGLSADGVAGDRSGDEGAAAAVGLSGDGFSAGQAGTELGADAWSGDDGAPAGSGDGSDAVALSGDDGVVAGLPADGLSVDGSGDEGNATSVSGDAAAVGLSGDGFSAGQAGTELGADAWSGDDGAPAGSGDGLGAAAGSRDELVAGLSEAGLVSANGSRGDGSGDQGAAASSVDEAGAAAAAGAGSGDGQGGKSGGKRPRAKKSQDGQAQGDGAKGDIFGQGQLFVPAQREGEDRPPSISEAELLPALEAILMVVDEPVGEILLAQVLDAPAERVADALLRLSARYTEEGKGFDLRRAAGGWRFYTRAEYSAYVERFVLDGQQLRLTQASLETLAVVAYKQPVTRSRISAIRGVNCDGVVKTLVTRGLIEECGTEPESGAHLYKTTNLFLEKLGLDSVAQLPPLAPFLPDNLDEVALNE